MNAERPAVVIANVEYRPQVRLVATASHLSQRCERMLTALTVITIGMNSIQFMFATFRSFFGRENNPNVGSLSRSRRRRGP